MSPHFSHSSQYSQAKEVLRREIEAPLLRSQEGLGALRRAAWDSCHLTGKTIPILLSLVQSPVGLDRLLTF